MSFQSLNERLTTLLDTTAQITELIQRLANLKFQPGSIPLEGEEGDVSHELSGEISQTLREQDEDLEILTQEVKDFYAGRAGSERARQRERLEEAVERASQELKTSRIEFRQAQLIAKRNIEAAQRQERSLLLASLAAPSRPNSPTPSTFRRRNREPAAELSKEDKEVQAASDVTAALRRTHQMMQNELSRSQFAHDTLKESTAALSQLGESYSTLDTLLAGSKNLLSTLLRSQKSDTWYLETAFYVLAATIAWLVFRRFIYGPGWWLVWLPLKLFYKAWMGVFVALGIRDNRDGVFASQSPSVVMSSRKPLITHKVAKRPPREERNQGKPLMPPNAYIPVGAGGPGARQADSSGMIAEVGRIIDNSNDQQKVVEPEKVVEQSQEQGEEQGNPKKRMWEEDVEVGKQERVRDEL